MPYVRIFGEGNTAEASAEFNSPITGVSEMGIAEFFFNNRHVVRMNELSSEQCTYQICKL